MPSTKHKQAVRKAENKPYHDLYGWIYLKPLLLVRLSNLHLLLVRLSNLQATVPKTATDRGPFSQGKRLDVGKGMGLGEG